MLRRTSATLFLSCSFLGCGDAPKVTVCVSDPANNGFQCHNYKTGVDSFLDYQESENFVAMSPGDSRRVLEYCKRKR
jgi:hypothetical protein